jgi:DNA (cytosine-5)-methyltransferase 1
MKIVSLFSGCGGLDLGFHKAGFQTIWANEYDKKITPTFKLNFPKIELDERSISDIPVEDVPSCVGIIGGPPCQSWSAAGSHRGGNDSRGQLFVEDYIRIVKSKKPKFFLAENVPGIKYKRHEESFQFILESLRGIGYNISYKVYNTYDYGVAQTRKRLVIVGYASGYETFFELPDYNGEKINLSDAIGYLKDNAVPAIGRTTPNPDLKELNHEFMVTPEKKNSFHYMSRNRVRGWDEPSFTIPATGRHVPQHPQAPKMEPVFDDKGKRIINVMEFKKGNKKLYRRLTIRECAAIQGFGPNFEFKYNSLDHGYKMIGNAVPVKFATLIARQIKKDMTKLDNVKLSFNKPGKIIDLLS